MAGTLLYGSYSRANRQTIRFDPVRGPLTNPLMGWAPWATIEESQQPHSLVYADLTWRELEPQRGIYDFEAFEAKQQLARWRREGKRVVFRFVADQPGDRAHMDIPDWLFEEMNGSGEYYDNEYGKGFSPDYSNPVFIDAHRQVITALGKRYGGDGFFAFIELGSLGHWGEWHTHPDLTPLPTEAIGDLYVRQYVQAFPGAHLLMRRPFKIARDLGLGLYNDMTADPLQTSAWLDWIERGQDASEADQGLAAMPAGWQKAPIGGEQASGLSNEQVYGADLEQTIELLQRSHTTFVGPNGPYKVEYGSSLQPGVDRALAAIGYRLYLAGVELPRRVHFGKNVHIQLTFANDGIAPMYYNWPVQVYVWDEKGNFIESLLLQMDLRQVLPGKPLEVAVDLPAGQLGNGTYSLGIAILDPLTRQPAVRLANQSSRPDLIQVLGSFEVKRIVGSG